MNKPREWWIYQNESCGKQYVVDKNQRGFDPDNVYVAYPVIQLHAYKDLLKENKELKETIKILRNNRDNND